MQNVLIIGFVWPEPNSSAAGSRMLQLIGLFQEQGWKVTLASAASDSEFMFDVTLLGVIKVPIQLNDSDFDIFVKDLNPSIVLFDRFMTEEQFGWRVGENCPEALRLLDTEDLHCLRQARQMAHRENRELIPRDLLSDVAKREIASILRCDLSLIISEIEMDLLLTTFKIDASLLYYLPFLVEPIGNSTVSNWPKFKDRNDFIFIGNFLHEPNWDTVQHLKQNIWPRIRPLLPGVSLRIYGAYPSQKVLQLHKPTEQFHIMGRAEDAVAVVRNARIVLAPIRFGAGAKGKLLEAMQCGTPSVTTSIGAESMAGTLPWNGTIADTPDAIAAAAAELYSNEALWNEAKANGAAIVNMRYAKADFDTKVMHHLLKLQNNLQAHREANFMGALLRHHTLASTKYMSKWIEAKNKV